MWPFRKKTKDELALEKEHELFIEINKAINVLILLEETNNKKKRLIEKIRKGGKITKFRDELMQIVNQETAIVNQEFRLLDIYNKLLEELKNLCLTLGGESLWNQSSELRFNLDKLNEFLKIIRESVIKQSRIVKKEFWEIDELSKLISDEFFNAITHINKFFRDDVLQKARQFFYYFETFEKKRQTKIKEFWEREIHNLVIYHGSSAMFLENIEKYGLDPTMKLFDASQLSFLENALSWKNGFKWGYAPEIYVTFYREVALSYAKEGPAIIFDTLPRAQQLYKEWQGRKDIIEGDRQKLLLFIKKCELKLKSHRPILISINPRSKPVFSRLPPKLKECMNDFNNFLNLVNDIIIKSHSLNVALDDTKEICLKVGGSDQREIIIKEKIPRKNIIKIEAV